MKNSLIYGETRPSVTSFMVGRNNDCKPHMPCIWPCYFFYYGENILNVTNWLQMNNWIDKKNAETMLIKTW